MEINVALSWLPYMSTGQPRPHICIGRFAHCKEAGEHHLLGGGTHSGFHSGV